MGQRVEQGPVAALGTVEIPAGVRGRGEQPRQRRPVDQSHLPAAVEQVELATLEWVWWWNNQRLHGELDMRTPIEVENAYYADLESAQPAAAGQGSR